MAQPTQRRTILMTGQPSAATVPCFLMYGHGEPALDLGRPPASYGVLVVQVGRAVKVHHCGFRHHKVGFLGGRPRGLLRATMTPWQKISPPQTPHGSARSIAPAKQAVRREHWRQYALAWSISSGRSENHRSPCPCRHGSKSARTMLG